MKNGLLLGLDGAGKTLLLRQLSLQLLKSHKSVVDRLLALAQSASCISSAANDVLPAAATAGSSPSPTPNSGQPGTTSGTSTTSASSHPVTVLHNALQYATLYHHHHQPPVDGGHLVDEQNGATLMRETQPTIGVEHTPLTIDGKAFSLCEVGGQLLPMWKAYFDGCDFWIFVVDLSTPSQLAGASIEFFNLMQVDKMRRKPKLLLLNKMDACFTMDDALVRAALSLDRLLTDAFSAGTTSGPMHVLKVSALSGENMDAVLKWISTHTTTSNTSTNGATNSTLAGHPPLGGGSTSRTTSGTLAFMRGEKPRVHPVAQ